MQKKNLTERVTMINTQQIKRAFEQADEIFMRHLSQKELDICRKYTEVFAAALTATQHDDIALQQAVADGWMGADNLGKYER